MNHCLIEDKLQNCYWLNYYIVSDAHSPSRPDEQRRIEEAKGWITEEKELFMGRLHRMDLSDPDIAEQAASGIQWTIIYRVLGESFFVKAPSLKIKPLLDA